MEQLLHLLYPLWSLCWYNSTPHVICSIQIFLQINCIFLAITLKVLYRRKAMNEQVNFNKDTVKYECTVTSLFSQLHILCYRSLLKAVIILVPLLGLTWIIGILAVNNETEVFAWIFAILNSLQVTANHQPLLHVHVYHYYLGCLHICTSCVKKQTGEQGLFNGSI